MPVCHRNNRGVCVALVHADVIGHAEVGHIFAQLPVSAPVSMPTQASGRHGAPSYVASSLQLSRRLSLAGGLLVVIDNSQGGAGPRDLKTGKV